MAGTVDESYRLGRAEALRDRERILEFWQRVNFSSPERPRQYDWFYLQPRPGGARIYLLLHGDAIVGTACVGSRLVHAPGDRTLRAGVLVDFVIDPAHRSVGPALKLQRYAREQEWLVSDVLYGIPDTKAVPIFKRLGADALVQVGSYAHVLRAGSYLARCAPAWAGPAVRFAAFALDPLRALGRKLSTRSNYRADWLPDIEGLREDAWKDVSRGIAMGERSREFLRWRFSTGRWRCARIHERRTNATVGYAMLQEHDGELHTGDILLPRDPRHATKALQALIDLSWREGATALRLDLAGDDVATEALRSAGMIRRSQRTCFFMRNPALPASDLPTSWWLTRADEDV